MSRPSPLASIRRLIRRHRRPLAAVLAAAAALLALTSLRAPAAPTSAGTSSHPSDPSSLRPGEVAVPVVLATAPVAATLRAGDLIDLISLRDDGSPSVAAEGVRVLEAATAGGFTSSASAVVMVAVAERDALDIAVSPERGFSLIVRTMAVRDGTH